MKKILLYLARGVKSILFNKIYRFYVEIGVYIRKKNCFKMKKFSNLKKYKNIHKGERCFIIATGPSLSLDDIEIVKDEITFSMNSICLLFDEIDWKPTYYAIQDIHVYKKLVDNIRKSRMKNVFISDFITRKFKPNKNWIQFPLNLLDHAYGLKKLDTKFSSDIYNVVYDGFTITYSILQIVSYMGFKEIYLLGADTNYEIGKPHHIKEHGAVDLSYKTAGERMIYAYNVAKKYFDKNEIKVYNLTRGGKLEVFQRKKLEDVLSNEKN